MATRRRGGYRPPSKPAAASGPGALSQRTDQPIRVAPGGDYGDRKASVDQQQAAPVAGERVSPGGGGTPTGPTPPDGIFAPTTRPNEPVSARGPAPMLDDDPDMLLRALNSMFPHPDLQRLLNRRG